MDEPSTVGKISLPPSTVKGRFLEGTGPIHGDRRDQGPWERGPEWQAAGIPLGNGEWEVHARCPDGMDHGNVDEVDSGDEARTLNDGWAQDCALDEENGDGGLRRRTRMNRRNKCFTFLQHS